MSPRRPPGSVLLAGGAALLLGPLSLGSLPSAAAAADPAPAAVQVTKPLALGTAPHRLTSSKLEGRLATSAPSDRQAVFVRLSGAGAAAVARSTLAGSRSSTRERAAGDAARDRRSSIQRTTASVLSVARRSDGHAQRLFSVSNAVPGVGLVTTTKALATLAARDDVVSIAALVPKHVANAGAAQLTRAASSWKSPGTTGRGVRIGIIDTGIDYTHADFGGPGTPAAYNAARADQSRFAATAKVVGGTDFVGDTYNADSSHPDTYQPVPQPDRNPLDCDGHGTHVAGTAAGYGVTAGGSTFRGSYARLSRSSLDALRVGPGMAPRASLYALKVFGCAGTTDAVIPALDWALDPNGDGNFADHLDIVDLSLASSYAPADDPENGVVDAVAAQGVLPVVAAGNDGDLTDVSGSPGNAVRALSVAGSVDERQLRDGLRIDAPSDLAGVAASQFSTRYAWRTRPAVSGAVVPLSADDADGCDPLGYADAAAVAGHVAWLEWDDDPGRRRCSSTVRSEHVAAAGAVGAVLTSGSDVSGSAIAGSADLPVVQLPEAETDRLRQAVATRTLTVTFDGSLAGTVRDVDPALSDTLSSSSSRGVHGTSGVVKPDVTAPGDTITSARIRSGNQPLTLSGTSMAAAVTTGVAALVVGQHPTWATSQVKAAVMNTAGHDLYTGTGHRGDVYGPARVGAGRVDALAAVRTSVLAYAVDQPGGVSASYGVVEAPADRTTVTRTRTIRVRNTGSHPTTARLAYQAVVKQPGVAYRVSRSTVTLKARGYVDVRLTMTATTAKLRHTIDPTMASSQTDAYLGEPGHRVQRARQYLSDASGRLLVTPAGRSALRVPVYGAAKPVSQTRAYDRTVGGGPALLLRGAGFDLGRGATAYESKLSVMTLGADSPRQPTCRGVQRAGCALNASARAGDLHDVGAGSTASAEGGRADGFLWFGVSTWGNVANIGSYNVPVVDIDTTGDGRPDFRVSVTTEPGTDLLTASLVKTSTGRLVDVQPANFLDGDIETNAFDTNVVLIPVAPTALGMTEEDTTFPIRYTVSTVNRYASWSSLHVQDSTAPISFDVADPAVRVDGPLYPDADGVAVPYRLSPSAPAGTRALVFHLHGRTGTKVESQSLSPSAR